MTTSLIRKLVLALVVTAPIGIALARGPVQNIDPARHPNLAAAQQLSVQAFERLTAAQQANDWDMNGHADRAKALLVQATEEMKAAALTANQRSR